MFLKTLSLAEALERTLERVRPLAQTETVAVREAQGRFLAASVCAPEDLPGFDRSSMDGYAVRAQDTFAARQGAPAALALVGRVEMGRDVSRMPPLQPGQTLGISTGGMLPLGADAVVMLEDTELDGQTLFVLQPVAPGASVIRADEDVQRGQALFEAGHRLRAQDLGALLGVGLTQLEVRPRLQVGVISTGDELVPAEQSPALGQVRDINAATTAAQLSALGMVPSLFGIVPDVRQQLADAASHALAECDAVLISGGSSVGVRDATVEILDGLGEVLVHGIRIAPGKPTIFALCGDKPAFGLPGNPVSSMIVFEVFVAPILLKRGGARVLQRARGRVQAELTKNVPSARGRDDFVRVRLLAREGRTLVEPIYAHSNNISSLSRADGVLPIPAEVEGYAKGETVDVELW